MLTANINPVDNSNHSHGRCSTANNACTTISTVTPQWSSPLPQYYRVLHFRYCGLPVVTEVLPLYPLPCRSVVSHLQMCYCRLAQSLFRFQWSNAGSSQVQRQQSVKLTGLVIDSLTDWLSRCLQRVDFTCTSVCVSSCPPPSLLNMPTGAVPLSLMMQQNNLALMRSVLLCIVAVYDWLITWLICIVAATINVSDHQYEATLSCDRQGHALLTFLYCCRTCRVELTSSFYPEHQLACCSLSSTENLLIFLHQID